MDKIKVAGLALVVLLLAGCGENKDEAADNKAGQRTISGDYISGALKSPEEKSAPQAEINQNNDTVKDMELVQKYPFAEISTSLGKIKVKLYGADAPLTVDNFLKLASENFYDGTKFHRVIKGFMIQGGDPNSKSGDVSTWGMGGPGYKFKDELRGTEKYPQGTLAMANSGPNTNGSQFFIVTASPAAMLPPNYTVFGEVVSGMDTALKIENVKTLPGDRPVDNVVIKNIAPLEK